MIERGVITAREGRMALQLEPGPRPSAPAVATASVAPPAGTVLTDAELRELERANLAAALEQSEGKVYGPGGAAERLGLKPTTVASRMQRLGLKRSDAD